MGDGDADRLELQCCRGYVFGKGQNTRGATQISELPEVDLLNTPVTNVVCERELGRFSNLAERTKLWNRFCTGRGLRYDMTLYKSEQKHIQKDTYKIMKLLLDRQKAWTEEQLQVK